MSKAALWNVQTDDIDSREAAREAARRQGRSLGEWLHSSATDSVVEADPCGQDANHEEMAPQRGAAGHETRVDLFGSRIGLTRRDRDLETRTRPTIDSQDISLARAIDAMERRTLRTKRRTSGTWEPASRSPDRYDVKRDRVSELAERLADIETHLTDRFPPVESNPVGATLARLEARLETIGRHNLAEAVALQSSLVQAQRPATQTDSFYRLEEKLDSILAAIKAWPSEASAIALVASQSARGRHDRDLDDAISDIGHRQRILEDNGRVSLKQAVQRRAVGAHRQTPSESASITALQSEIATLASKIEGLCHDVADRRQSSTTADLHPVRTDISAISKTLRDLSRRIDLSSAETSVWALIEALDSADAGEADAVTLQLKSAATDLCKVLADIDLTKEIKAATDKLRTIGRRVDDLEDAKVGSISIEGICRRIEELRALVATAMEQPSASNRVKGLVGLLRTRLVEQAAGTAEDVDAAIEELRDLTANPPSGMAFARVYASVDALSAEFDNAIAEGKSGAMPRSVQAVNHVELENQLRELSQKMEAVQAPGADHQAIDDLQKQIALLSARFENSDDGFAKLNSLQQSMQDVLAHLEQTRASVETSAAEAAREVVRVAIAEGQGGGDRPSAESLSKIQLMQDEAEARTGSVLSAVQETLSKVVDRLSSMETDIAEVRKARTLEVAPIETRPKQPVTIPLGAPDPVLDKAIGSPTIETFVETSLIAKPSVEAVAFVEPDAEPDRSDFIAAARRAAKAAQTDLRLTETKRPMPLQSERVSRSLLIEQSRDYIARHKKPVLLGVAALVFIVGTVAIMQRAGMSGSNWLAPRVQTAATPKAAPQPAKVRIVDGRAANPSAAPTGAEKTARGTDPVQTGSIAPLPVFTAPLTAPRVPAPPTIPVKLKSMAEAGDGGAEFVLGTQYAEGRGTPRDFKTAATWYQKAADQGVAPAQYRLASLYEKGLGVQQDKVKARSLYLQAAEAGNPRAMHNLAVLLADGDGKPDYGGAATWFRRAAQHGMEDSQFNLGILLARGLGVQQSLVQSYQWFAIAATQEDPEAAKKRDEVASKLSAADLAVAKALAASFRPRSVATVATEVAPPPGGWDGAPSTSPINSAKQKLSSL